MLVHRRKGTTCQVQICRIDKYFHKQSKSLQELPDLRLLYLQKSKNVPLYGKGLKGLFSSYLHKMVYLMIFNLVYPAE